jgi:hypothetical protein
VVNKVLLPPDQTDPCPKEQDFKVPCSGRESTAGFGNPGAEVVKTSEFAGDDERGRSPEFDIEVVCGGIEGG